MSLANNYYVNVDGGSSRRPIFIISLSLILLTTLMPGLVIAGIIVRRSDPGNVRPPPTSTADAIRSTCSLTLYPKSCFSALVSAGSSDPEKLFQHSLTASIGALEAISTFPEAYAEKAAAAGRLAKEALGICRYQLDDASGALNDAVSAARLASDHVDDLRTWLSAAVTGMGTCLDALQESNVAFAGEIQLLMRNSTELASNSLAIVSKLLPVLVDRKGRFHRRLLAEGDRRILQDSWPMPHLTVAIDGSGDCRSVTEAVSKIPNNSNDIFVVYVKSGTYKENVVLDNNQWNVMMYGDVNGGTIITGSKNRADGISTFYTATFRVMGRGFCARDMVFRNTAGPEKQQAVAMMSQSDQSVYYRCTFEGFQDTLYVHSYRQFYRECSITGTIDFIFGYAAAVFQNCTIMPRQPMQQYQYNTITAHVKYDTNQDTGISIQGCVIKPYLDQPVTVQTYLGRPWGPFSTTVIMKTEIDECVNPAGWIAWDLNVSPPKTIFYGEYQNTGPGANTYGRVTWDGYKPKLELYEASRFTVESLITGGRWLPAEVPYDPTL